MFAKLLIRNDRLNCSDRQLLNFNGKSAHPVRAIVPFQWPQNNVMIQRFVSDQLIFHAIVINTIKGSSLTQN